jgi:DNA repair exonuclease SbcCD ATPase subunit
MRMRLFLYQFADPNGHVYYTDDPAAVAKTEGVKTSSDQMAGDSSSDSGDAVSKEKGAAADELKLLEIRIAEEEQWLEKDRTAILKEKELLGNDRKRAQTPEQIRNYNQRIKNYNDRISDFLRRQSRLEDDRAEWKALRDTIAADGAKAEKAAPSGAEDVALDKRREALDAEYETLMSEKKKLEKAAKKAKTIEEKRQLNAQITDFNKKIKGYASKKDALNADIQEYNKQVTANLSDQVKEITAAENESGREQPSYDENQNRWRRILSGG